MPALPSHQETDQFQCRQATWKVIPKDKVSVTTDAITEDTSTVLAEALREKGWFLYPILLEIETPLATGIQEAIKQVDPIRAAFNDVLFRNGPLSPDLINQVCFGGLGREDGKFIWILFATPSQHNIKQEDNAQQAVFNLIHWANNQLRQNHIAVVPDVPLTNIESLEAIS